MLVLPAPLGPSNPNISFYFTLNEMSATAGSGCDLYFISMCLTWIFASVLSDAP